MRSFITGLRRTSKTGFDNCRIILALFVFIPLFSQLALAQDVDLGVSWLQRDLDNLDAYPCMRMITQKVTGSAPTSQQLKDILAQRFPSQLNDPGLPDIRMDELLQLYGVGLYNGAAFDAGFIDQLRGNLDAGMPAILGTYIPTPNRQFVVNGYKVDGGKLWFRIQDPAESPSEHSAHPSGYLAKFSGNFLQDQIGHSTEIRGVYFVSPSYKIRVASLGELTYDVVHGTFSGNVGAFQDVLKTVAPYCGSDEIIDFDYIPDQSNIDRTLPMILRGGKTKSDYSGFLKDRLDITSITGSSPIWFVLNSSKKIDLANLKSLLNTLSIKKFAQSIDGAIPLSAMEPWEYYGIWNTYNDPVLLLFHFPEPERLFMYKKVLRELLATKNTPVEVTEQISKEFYDGLVKAQSILGLTGDVAEVYKTYRPEILRVMTQEYLNCGQNCLEGLLRLSKTDRGFDRLMDYADRFGKTLVLTDLTVEMVKGAIFVTTPISYYEEILDDLRRIRPYLTSNDLQFATDAIIFEVENERDAYIDKLVEYLGTEFWTTLGQIGVSKGAELLTQAIAPLVSYISGAGLAVSSSVLSVAAGGLILTSILANLPEVSAQAQLAAYSADVAKEIRAVTYNVLQPNIASQTDPSYQLLQAYSAGVELTFLSEQLSFAHIANAINSYHTPPFVPGDPDNTNAIAHFRGRAETAARHGREWSSPSVIDAIVHSTEGRIWVYSPTEHPFQPIIPPIIPQKPTAPTGVTATPGDKSVTLSWAPNPSFDNVAKYIVYRTTNPISILNYQKIKEVLAPTTVYYDQNLTNGTTYYYKVSAANSVGESNLSDPPASATPQGVTCNLDLLSPLVSPQTGDPGTSIELRVTYKNSCNRPPQRVDAVIDGTIHQPLLRRDNVAFTIGSSYAGWNLFGPGQHSIYFEATDGLTTKITQTFTINISPAPSSQMYISNIQVNPPYYSPNGDGVQDVTNVSFQISGSFTRRGRIDLYNLFDQLISTPYSWEWRQPGTYSADVGPAIPDGTYKVKVSATNFGVFIQEYDPTDGWAGFDIAVGPDGNFYVLTSGERIDVLGPNLNIIRSIGGQPNQPGNGLFSYPLGLHVDNNGNIFVAESGRSRIIKLTSTGSVLMSFGIQEFQPADPSHLYLPCDVVTDENGNIYVLDIGNSRIKKFGPSGNFLLQSATTLNGSNQYNFHKIIYDGSGHLYVSDFQRVLRFNKNLELEKEYSTASLGIQDPPIIPAAIAIDKDGNLIVASSSSSNQQCVKFDVNTGQLLDYYYGFGYAQGGGNGFNHSNGMVILANGDILTAWGDGAYGTLRKYANSNPKAFAGAYLICDVTPPATAISFPVNQGAVSGTVPVEGTATDANFDFYSLWYRQAGQSNRTSILSAQFPVNNSFLGAWNTDGLSSDQYYLILTASDKAGNSMAESVLVNIGGGKTPPLVHDPNLFGLARCFNGTDDYILVPNSSSLNVTSGLTIEAWIKLDQLPGPVEYAIVSKWAGTGSSGGRYMLGVTGGATPGKLILNLQDIGAMSNQTLSPGQWFHVAVTFNGSQFKFYINGQLDNTVPGISSFGSSNTPLAIGKNIHNNITPSVNPYFFKGEMDEVRISNIARSPASFCLNAPCTPDGNTMALWYLNEVSGTLVDDASANNNDGTVQGTGCQELPPAVAFCDNFDDGNGWQSRWTNIYGTQTLVSSPAHSESGALKFRGSNFGCHSVLQRTNFQAAAGIYSAWFNQLHYEAGLWMNIQVQPDADPHPSLRPSYELNISAQNSQEGSFDLARQDGLGGAVILLHVQAQFNMNEWVRAFIKRKLPDTLIVGYERNGQVHSYVVVDPNPITNPGGFYISSCSDVTPTDNYYDDVSYNPDPNGTGCPQAQPLITLTKPNGGETVMGGKIQRIEWEASNLSQGKILVELNTGSGWNVIYATQDLNARSFDWIVPQVASNSAQLFIGVWDGASWLAADFADGPFTIVPAGQPLAWKTSGNLLTDCNGPFDLLANAWLNNGFNELGWSSVTLPDVNWGCDNCDRFYRLNLPITFPGNMVKAYLRTDDGSWLYVNGKPVGHWGGECHQGGCVNDPYGVCLGNDEVSLLDLTPYLHFGNNVISAHVSQASGHQFFDLQLTQSWFGLPIVFLALSPVDLQVQSPSGQVFSKNGSLPADVLYYELDYDGDGDLDDEVIIQNPEQGNYGVTVIPQLGASPTETYSLVGFQYGIQTYLARNIPIGSIPNTPYQFAASLQPPDIIKAITVPSTWYQSWLTGTTGTVRCQVGNFPTGYDASKVVPSSIRLNGYIQLYGGKYRILSSATGFTGNVLEVAFDRVEAVKSLDNPQAGKKYQIYVTGNFTDRKKFVAYYNINVCQDPYAACNITASFEPIVIEEEPSQLPIEFSLSASHPNPFNATTQIEYAIPTDAEVKLDIFNVMGQKVRTLVDEPQTAGYKTVIWDGKNGNGDNIASGIYFYRIKAGEFIQSRKMVLLK